MVAEGEIVSASGYLTQSLGLLGLSLSQPSDPSVSDGSYDVRLELADDPPAASTVGRWIAVVGTWVSGTITAASILGVSTPTFYKRPDPPRPSSALGDYVTSKPIWWDHSNDSAPTSLAFQKAACAGLIVAHCRHHSQASGYSFIAITDNPEETTSLLYPAFQETLVVVQSRHPRSVYLNVAQTIESAMQSLRRTRVLQYGQLIGSDYQRYENIVVDVMSSELIDLSELVPERTVSVEATCTSPL